MMRKYALITGGTKGIGKAVAECLAEAGYDLLLTFASDSDTARSVQSALCDKYAVNVGILQADSSDMKSIETIDSFLESENLMLDAVILNAGTTCRDSFENIRFEDWSRVFTVNVHFPVFLLQKILSRMNPESSVIFTGSLMAIEPHSVSLAYGVTKSAVHSLVKNLVKFLAPYGIRVNGVAPGFVDTEWQKNKPLEIRHNIERKVSMGRFCEPEEVAEVYKTLLENKYFNGEIIVIDGGYSYK